VYSFLGSGGGEGLRAVVVVVVVFSGLMGSRLRFLSLDFLLLRLEDLRFFLSFFSFLSFLSFLLRFFLDSVED